MAKEHVFYRAGPTSTELIAAHFKQRAVAFAECDRSAEEMGIDCYVANGSSVVGFRLKPGQSLPPGTRLDRKGLCVPAKKTEEGKKLVARLKALPRIPTIQQLSEELLGSMRLSASEHGGFRFVQCGVVKIGSEDDGSATYFVEMFEGDKPPEDCTPIKKSEYYALVEAEQAKATSSAPPTAGGVE